MSANEPLPVELRDVESRLASLAPAASRLHRDRLMFEAGRAASAAAIPRDESARIWKRATLALAASVVVLATAVVHAYLARPAVQREIVYLRPSPEPQASSPAVGNKAAHGVDEVPGSQEGPPQRTTVESMALDRYQPAINSASYLHQRNLALRSGVDALPFAQAGAADPSPSPTVQELLDELLPGVDGESRASNAAGEYL